MIWKRPSWPRVRLMGGRSARGSRGGRARPWNFVSAPKALYDASQAVSFEARARWRADERTHRPAAAPPLPYPPPFHTLRPTKILTEHPIPEFRSRNCGKPSPEEFYLDGGEALSRGKTPPSPRGAQGSWFASAIWTYGASPSLSALQSREHSAAQLDSGQVRPPPPCASCCTTQRCVVGARLTH